MFRTTALFTALTSLIVATGCTIISDQEEKTDNSPSTNTTKASGLLLRKVQTCDELTVALREEMALTLAKQAEANRGWGTGGVVMEDGMAPPMVPGASPSNTATATGDASADGESGKGAQDFTSTNTQVEGIDESDIVKTDGKRIYVLRNNELLIADAFPADTMKLDPTLTLEGGAVEMFAVPRKDGSTRLVIYSRALGTPGKYGVTTADMAMPMYCEMGYCDLGGANATRVTVVDVAADGTTTKKLSLTYEGTYLSARRDGEKIRTILQLQRHFEGLNYYLEPADELRATMLAGQKLEAAGISVETATETQLQNARTEATAELLAERNAAGLAALDAEDFLPSVTVEQNGKSETEMVDCNSFYVPRTGTASMGITMVAELDMDALESLQPMAFLGDTNTVYANQSSLALTTQTWDPTTGSNQTVLHAFELSSSAAPVHEGSALVPGYLYGQFALNERDGAYYAATTTNDNSTVQKNNVYVLTPGDAGKDLTMTGKLEGIAPNENIRSMRYLGDKAYMVTFENTDPLFVIDLANPKAPKVLGSVEIPGFSSYIHPLGADHLLTIGRAGNEWGAGSQMQVQIFDVSDPSQPKQAHSYVVAEDGMSIAEYDHRAFTFHAETGTLMVPFQSWNWDGVNPARTNWLEVLHVSADKGITGVGRLGGTAGVDYCGNGVTRGIMMDEVVYAVSNTAIDAAPLSGLDKPVPTLEFSNSNSCMYNYMY